MSRDSEHLSFVYNPSIHQGWDSQNAAPDFKCNTCLKELLLNLRDAVERMQNGSKLTLKVG